jgi:hypothetical protein
VSIPNGPRILIWDIETAPNLGYTWGKWQQDVIAFEHEWYLLSIAWKWHGESAVHVRGLDDYKRYDRDPENDFELAKLAHALFDEADIVVAHNGKEFDTKKAQARMIAHGFDPPSSFREVDTLKIARANFAFTSNRLDDICRLLGIGGKKETGGFGTWRGCLRGDPKAWRKMKRYNRHDVVLLEQLYERLRPWGKHPNVATMVDRSDACPTCGSTKGFLSKGYSYTPLSRRKRWKCKACGASVSDRKTERLSASKV